jgi:hypothetical protein
LAPWLRKNANATFLPALGTPKNISIGAKCGSATASTGTRKARCIGRLQPIAGPMSPSVTHAGR